MARGAERVPRPAGSRVVWWGDLLGELANHRDSVVQLAAG
jgi:hypothetical protein